MLKGSCIASLGDAALATASDYALRGEAHLSRGKLDAAVVDLSKAIQMAPAEAGYYADRARAYATERQLGVARANLDKSLRLDLKDIDTLASARRISPQTARPDRCGSRRAGGGRAGNGKITAVPAAPARYRYRQGCHQ